MRATRSGERGQSLPLIIMMFVVLCGFVGLTIDVGFGLLQKRRLQAAVDLGLVSGAQDLPSASAAAASARSFTSNNFALASDQAVTVNTSTGCMVSGCSSHDRLNLSASTRTPTFFLGLFGVDEWSVAARGSACGPCDSSPVSYDVVVVLDRSGSMSDGDMVEAKEGIEELLDFFSPATDRIGLVVLESEDRVAPRYRNGATPCDSGGTNYASTSYSPITQAYTGYGGAAGAFMDGTAASHDPFLLVPLAAGNNYKHANGTVNVGSQFVSTLRCIDNRGSTPIGPAMDAARQELVTNGRSDTMKVIIYFGDGGASSIPLLRRCQTRTGGTTSNPTYGTARACVANEPTTTRWNITSGASWYTWSSGNRDRPCADAIVQSQRAAAADIDVYTIGYGVSDIPCQPGVAGTNPSESPVISQAVTIERMASDSTKYYRDTNRGDVRAIFQAIGHSITAGGTRLVD